MSRGTWPTCSRGGLPAPKNRDFLGETSTTLVGRAQPDTVKNDFVGGGGRENDFVHFFTANFAREIFGSKTSLELVSAILSLFVVYDLLIRRVRLL